MTKVIVMGQGGGGVGKTTVAASIATGLAAGGKRVLALDCDGQSQLCHFLGVESSSGMRKWLNSIEYTRKANGDELDLEEVSKFVVGARPGLDIVPADEGLTGAASYAGQRLPLTIMRQILPAIGEGYDYLIIDCKPGDILAEMMWLAADLIVVPAPVVAVDMDKLQNFITLLPTTFARAGIARLPARLVVPNKFDAGVSASFSNWSDLRESLEGSDWHLFEQPLPNSAIIAKAFEEHVSPMEYESRLDTATRFKQAIRALVEVIK